MEHEMIIDDNNADLLPERLITSLEAADSAPALVTARVDRAIALSARQQFAVRPARRHAPAWFALAASVLLAVVLLPSLAKKEDTGLIADIDRSGQIDIADVFALARRNRQSTTRKELDAFAMQIVSLQTRVDAS
jgi:hypothetical protein